MLKILGCSLILSASLGLAFCIQKEMKEHLFFLYEFRKLLVDINYEAKYSMQTMELIFLYRIRSRDEQIQYICKEIGNVLMEKKERDGSAVWHDTWKKYRKELGVCTEEAEIIEGAGEIFFGKSMEENKNALELLLERWNEWIAMWQKERREKQKVYQTTCVMCGLILIILLV